MWLISKIVGLFTRATGAAIKGTVDTAKSVTDIEKNRLDIKLKKQELAEKDRLIRPATFDEVKLYDPKVKKIERKASNTSQFKLPVSDFLSLTITIWQVLFWLIILLALAFFIWKR